MSVVLRDSAKTGNGRNTSQNQTQQDQFADSEELSRALDTRRRQLASVLQRKFELLRLSFLHTEKVSSVEIALAKAHRFAHYDELTGLPNRRLLLDRFVQASTLAKRHRRHLALLFFDVNDFKSVNDNLGHEAGDKLLMQVATRLSTSIRKSDTACRYGGDEFVVMLTEIDNHDHAVAALQKIRARLAPPYEIDRYSLRLTVSNGLAIYPKDAQRFTDLLRLADGSMFGNKSGSRGRSGGAPKLNIWLNDTKKEPRINR